MTAKELTGAKTMAERFGFTLSDIGYDDLQKRIGKASALALESRFLSVVEDEEMGVEAKKKALQGLVAKVGDYSKTYNYNVKGDVLQRLMVDGLNQLLKPMYRGMPSR